MEADKLCVGDRIDFRDGCGRFFSATIIAKNGTNLQIHYDGFSIKEWSDYISEQYRFAKYGSISKRLPKRLKYLRKGNYVKINPLNQRFHKISGQIEVRLLYRKWTRI